MDTLFQVPLREIDSESYLANVVWASLSGAQKDLAQQHGHGRRYRPDLTVFGAAETYSEDRVADITAMLREGERLTLFTSEKPAIPRGVNVVREATILQMVAARRFDARGNPDIARLGEEDADDMLSLARLTEPGPYKQNAGTMGRFYGIRKAGRLVSMIGERMVAGKYVELTAVCTHPDWRGHGLAKQLICHLSEEIQARGAVPFLHVFTTNAPAINLYRRLDFLTARAMYVTALMLPRQAG